MSGTDTLLSAFLRMMSLCVLFVIMCVVFLFLSFMNLVAATLTVCGLCGLEPRYGRCA